MKHTIKILAIMLLMFLVTQLIGLYVINFYLSGSITIPYGFDNQLPEEKTAAVYGQIFISFVISFIIAVTLALLLIRIKFTWFLRVWFFIVVSLALGVTFNVLALKLGIIYPALFALIIGLVLGYIKIFKRNIIIHNFTELLIYPGIAVIFVSMLNIWVTVGILILISLYDLWAVWRSGIMQKMAKFQINKLGVLGGFFIPYASDKVKEKIKLLKLKYKSKNIPEGVAKKNKLIVNLAILGGGDVVFPLIAAGVALKTFNSIYAALIVTLFAFLALLVLFLIAERKKSYPAMPYLTIGIFIGFIVARLLF